jgi:hypothetical protein
MSAATQGAYYGYIMMIALITLISLPLPIASIVMAHTYIWYIEALLYSYGGITIMMNLLLILHNFCDFENVRIFSRYCVYMLYISLFFWCIPGIVGLVYCFNILLSIDITVVLLFTILLVWKFEFFINFILINYD